MSVPPPSYNRLLRKRFEEGGLAVGKPSFEMHATIAKVRPGKVTNSTYVRVCVCVCVSMGLSVITWDVDQGSLGMCVPTHGRFLVCGAQRRVVIKRESWADLTLPLEHHEQLHHFEASGRPLILCSAIPG
jgi:hypothetical protein